MLSRRNKPLFGLYYNQKYSFDRGTTKITNGAREYDIFRTYFGGQVMDKHIGTLNVMESSYAHIRKNDSEFEAIEAAISALQEQVERNKGCPYCDPKNVDYYYAGNVPNYCKHCGRKLK